MTQPIYCSFLPTQRGKFVNLFGLMIARKTKAYRHDGSWYWYEPSITDADRSHHERHTRQMKEMLYIFFYLYYALSYIFQLIRIWYEWRIYKAISETDETLSFAERHDLAKELIPLEIYARLNPRYHQYKPFGWLEYSCLKPFRK